MLRLSRPTLRSAKRLGKKSSKENLLTAADGIVVPSVGCFSQCGRKHANNEDRVYSSTLPGALGADQTETFSFSDMLSMKPDDIIPEEVVIAGVFDGHGGGRCVEYVSKNLPRHVAKAITTERRTFEQLESAVFDGFKTCEDEFLHIATQSGDTSGCCALLALVHQNQILISWAGDSRAVFYDGKRVEQLSTDHRVSNHHEHRRILDNGGTVVNNRVQGVLTPSRSFGDIDIRAASPDGVLIAEPSVIVKLRIPEAAICKQQAFVVLASDGIWDAFSNDMACEIVSRALKTNGNNAEEAAMKLAEEASKSSSDDLSCVVITWSVVPFERFSGISIDSALSDEGEKF